MKPFLKWSGGKTRIVGDIMNNFPAEIDYYVEPFVGAGTVLFKLQPQNALISDINCNLINCYIMIRDNINQVLKLLNELSNEYKSISNDDDKKTYYYDARNKYNSVKYYNKDLESKVLKERILCASLFIFLNKTCFNGLYRENKKGEYNVPMGKYKNPTITNSTLLNTISQYLRSNNIEIVCCSYDETLKLLGKIKTKYENIVIYMDPPYYISDTSKFVSYTPDIFDNKSQEELKQTIDDNRKYYKIFVSNSDCKEVRKLYKEYTIRTISVARSISSKTSTRQTVLELFIEN